jgi:hypothetical protein
MSFRDLSARVLEPISIGVMVIGIVAVSQPWSLTLHSYGITITLIGLIGFNVFSKIKPASNNGPPLEHGRDHS